MLRPGLAMAAIVDGWLCSGGFSPWWAGGEERGRRSAYIEAGNGEGSAVV
jgi:hypothetical protein